MEERITPESSPLAPAAAASGPEPSTKSIVVLSDGTGNRGAKAQGTNVWALYERLERGPAPAGTSAPRQIAFYDDGVGTQKFLPLKLLGGVFGWGLYRNVRNLYASIVRSYEPGDALFLFGFSRGAYTVRTLAGLLARYGVLKRAPGMGEDDLARAIDATCLSQRATFAEMRRRRRLDPEANEESVLLGGLERADFHHQPTLERPYGVNVRFLGVWDTVDAVGLPFDSVAEALNRVFQWRFADRRVSARVQHARQALSIDDERRTFLPNLWDERREPPTPPGERPRVEQVWFAGVHTNVGGGYDKDQLAYVSLDWMLCEARAAGLRFPDDAHQRIRREADPLGLMVDSRAGLGALYRYQPRDVTALAAQAGRGHARLHVSVLERVREAPLGYAPVLLPGQALAVATCSGAPAPPQPVVVDFDAAARARALGQVRQKQRIYTLLLVVLAAPLLLLLMEACGREFDDACLRNGRLRVLGTLAALTLLGLLAFRHAEALAFGSARAPALVGRRWRVAGVRLAFACALLAACLAVAAVVLGALGSALLRLTPWLGGSTLGAAFGDPRRLALWYGLGLLAALFAKRRVEARLRVESLDALAPLRRGPP